MLVVSQELSISNSIMSTSDQSKLLLTCEFCGADVGSEDGYRSHLKLVHNLMKNIPLILGRAVKKTPEVSEAIEEIIIDDDDDDIEDQVEDKDCEENFAIKIENQISSFVQDLFKNLNVMIDGILPEDLDVKDTKEEAKETKESQEISSCFDDLRSFVENLEIPSDFTLEEFLTNDKSEKAEFAPPSTFKNQTKITTNNKTPVIEQKSVLSPKPKSGLTLYLCPVDECSFKVTREGFENGTAAKHLKNIHKVKATDMEEKGKFKFQKIKGERLNKK